MQWYPWFIEDFRRDTAHLSLAEEGAYRRLIDEYMHRCGPLPDSDPALARLIGIGLPEWSTLAPAVRPFFKPKGDKLSHKRCEQELRAQELRSRKRTEIAKKAAFGRWSKNRGLNALSNGRAMLRDATLTKNTFITPTEYVAEGASELERIVREKKWV